MEQPISTEDTTLSADTHKLSIGVLVLNYNTWDIALRAIGAAIELEFPSTTEFVLFDDGSPTPPPDNIDSRIRVIRNDVNRGFASALVVAFPQMKSDIVVLFDSDAFPLVPFADRVRRQFGADERLAQIGFQSQDENGVPTESLMKEPTKWSLLLGQAFYAHVPKLPMTPENLCAIAGCMATRLTAYREVGGIDANFDMLDLDLDYSMRLRKNHWKVVADRAIKVFHVGGGTPQLQRKRLLRFYKCRWYLLRKHGIIRNAGLARTMILMRLRFDQLILNLFGKYLFPDPEILSDKLIGRRDLIAYCSSNYK
jgi:GT2 family glycosyltransferase